MRQPDVNVVFLYDPGPHNLFYALLRMMHRGWEAQRWDWYRAALETCYIRDR